MGLNGFTDRLAAALAEHEPRLLKHSGRRPAAVAMIVADETPSDPELLLIRRARRQGDPWSGHLAFPGGRVDPADSSPRMAAERETREETGLDLGTQAVFLGQLNDLGGAGHPVTVSGFAYALERRTDALVLEPAEVAAAFWVPIAHLLEPERWTRHAFRWNDRDISLPAIDLGLGPETPVLWGLTYRFVVDAMDLVGFDGLPRAW